MKRYLKIYYTLIRFSAIMELEYRWSFFVEVCIELLYFSITLVTIKVFFANITSVAGWDYNSMLVLLGINMVFSEILLGIAFIFNLRKLPEFITNGTVDLFLAKPLNSQFSLSLWRPYFALIPGAAIGIIVAIIGLHSGGYVFQIIPLMQFLVLFTCGLVIGYAVATIVCATSFWVIGTGPIPNIAEQFIFMAKNPYSVYTGAWKVLFLFVIPISFMVSIPTRTLMGYIEWWWIPTAIILAGLFLFASHRFWNFVIKSYTSASS